MISLQVQPTRAVKLQVLDTVSREFNTYSIDMHLTWGVKQTHDVIT